MKKAFKIIGRVFLILLAVVLLFLAVLFVYNQVMLKKEEPLVTAPLGQLVEIDGHDMCVYTQGEGDHTLVFLSGSGTPSPILDFKSLYDQIGDGCRVVVIEKFGYGFSDIVDEERSFDTMLRQDREALEKLGIGAPYILCPHSMSGLEAIQWAQEYPDEVEAIVGLDMALPDFYDVLDLKGTERKEILSGIAVKMGLLRIVDIEDMFPAFSSDGLTDEEKDIYRALMYRITCNKVIINENETITETCDKIRSRPKPDVPTLIFTSDGRDADGDGWVQIEEAYADGLTNSKIIELNCGHYIHNYEYERISKEMNEFIKGLG
ncbi:MAG: alpha/beta hydrolase [Oscillospiraceae bacterium]|nr:alpha/beta hydrolase [Oscillospiraceae bacterium]